MDFKRNIGIFAFKANNDEKKAQKRMSFLDGYKMAIQNAKNHFEVAKICADKRLFGNANSHLIFASEEFNLVFQLTEPEITI